ncbi:hypothetical protein [Streptomyces sp. CBMA156]|uniref:hypothetical protein n=1 Tax=Streptomyces sp. CBMA156 TaxID=1930280 RepID=UPI001661AE24|nr:hypothetical protein [Streptomyces sp. CBMA156]
MRFPPRWLLGRGGGVGFQELESFPQGGEFGGARETVGDVLGKAGQVAGGGARRPGFGGQERSQVGDALDLDPVLLLLAGNEAGEKRGGGDHQLPRVFRAAAWWQSRHVVSQKQHRQ